MTDMAERFELLRKPFDPSQIGKLPRKSNGRTIHLDYVGHAAVTARLLEADSAWSWEPVAFDGQGLPLITIADGQATLWIRLTVCGVTRFGVGTCPANAFELPKQLISDALRNAAMRFGVALDLWSKEDLHPPEPVEVPPPADPALVERVSTLKGVIVEHGWGDAVKALGLDWPWSPEACDTIDELLNTLGDALPEEGVPDGTEPF